jgi:hypothetical protein
VATVGSQKKQFCQGKGGNIGGNIGYIGDIGYIGYIGYIGKIGYICNIFVYIIPELLNTWLEQYKFLPKRTYSQLWNL